MDLEKILCGAARAYRTLNTPVIKSDIDMTHKLYETEDADTADLTVTVKGQPVIKLLDLIVLGSAVAIFVAMVAKVLHFLTKH